jgi:signal transduction histidine kinase
VAYAVHLFVRLRANAAVLRQRLGFEALIASISTQFINLPRDRVRADIRQGLARLVDHADLDCAQIVACRGDEADISGSSFYRASASIAPPWFEEAHELASRWSLASYERQGCICVPDVAALPASREKALLRARQVRSWLCAPMWCTGERLGFLGLETTSDKRYWPEDDIALFRMAAEIFANAIARERNEAEREALQVRLNHSQRLEAIGTLAGGIAHEFNNILGAILGYGEMTLAQLREGSPARRHVTQIMKAGERAQGVVEQILAFGRRRERRSRPVRVEAVVAEAVDLIRASFPSTLSVRAHLRGGGAATDGDPTELQQVLMNLGTNAAHAMNERGVIEIELDPVECSYALALSHGTLPPGRYVRLAVTDTGHGIDERTMERIFEPFFTTKPVGQGTGLGLAVCKEIVEKYAGRITAGRRHDVGSVFTVYLPRGESETAGIDERR